MGKSAGKIMPLPRGAYDENATYNILDMVTLDNKLWIAKKSGITGIEPSKTAPEWMMAVDGTTDVKGLETEVDAKFASIDEQFLAKDTQISGLNTRVTAAEGSITSLGGRCDEIEGKFVFDTKPTKGSNKLITSGTAYDMLNKSFSSEIDADGDYETQGGSVSVSGGGVWLEQKTEQRYTNDDGLSHRDMTATLSAQNSSVYMRSSLSLHNDHTSSSYGETGDSSITVRNNRIGMDFKTNSSYKTNRNRYVYVYLDCDAMWCDDDGIYDIGKSDSRFKNIYASTGVIQTSDANEKNSIYDINGDLAREIIMGLKPVTYKFNSGTSDRTHYGLIAQDVEKIINELGIDNKDFAGLIKNQKVIHRTEKKQVGINENGEAEYIENIIDEPVEGEYIYGLRYDEFIAILIKMCQNLQNEVNELKNRLGGE